MSFWKDFIEGFGFYGKLISTIVNTVLLSLTYIIAVGLTALFAKLFKQHFMELKTNKEKTYWKELNLKKKPLEKYYRQF